MKIGVDIDEVLADFLPALIAHHNAKYGTLLSRDQFKTYRFWETWGGTREEAIQKTHDFYQTEDFKNIKPVFGSQKAINIIKENNDLLVITSRQHEITKATEEWIDKYFPNVFSEIHFANHYAREGSEITKKQICNSVGVEMLIEDSLDYAIECIAPTRKIILLDYPWNKTSILPKGIHRVQSRNEINQLL